MPRSKASTPTKKSYKGKIADPYPLRFRNIEDARKFIDAIVRKEKPDYELAIPPFEESDGTSRVRQEYKDAIFELHYQLNK